MTDIDPLQGIGADGPAYWNARAAINLVHQKKDYGNTQLYFSSGKKEEGFSNKCFISCRRGNQIRLARKSGRTFKGAYSNYPSIVRILVSKSWLRLFIESQCPFQTPKSSSIRVYLRSRAAAITAIQVIDVTEGGQNERIF